MLLPCFRGDVDVSAVCQYQISNVKEVFKGAYKEYREASQRWGRYTGSVPSPRPGSVRNWKFCTPYFLINRQNSQSRKLMPVFN